MPFDPQQLITLQAIAFDVDGVLTDGTFAWSATGEESKNFSFADVMGVSLLRRLGIKMALISGEHSSLVDRYAEKLHIPFVAKGTRDKATAIRDFTVQFGISLEHGGMAAAPAALAERRRDGELTSKLPVVGIRETSSAHPTDRTKYVGRPSPVEQARADTGGLRPSGTVHYRRHATAFDCEQARVTPIAREGPFLRARIRG